MRQQNADDQVKYLPSNDAGGKCLLVLAHPRGSATRPRAHRNTVRVTCRRVRRGLPAVGALVAWRCIRSTYLSALPEPDPTFVVNV